LPPNLASIELATVENATPGSSQEVECGSFTRKKQAEE
jgi:hypothetical protein